MLSTPRTCVNQGQTKGEKEKKIATMDEEKHVPAHWVDKPEETAVNMIEDVQVDEVHHTPLAVALTEKTTGLMAFFSFWVALGGWLVNFDLGYTGIVLQMQPFNHAFGHCGKLPVPGARPGTEAYRCELSAPQQSAVTVYVLFMAVGGGLSSITGSYLGRKRVIQLSNLFICIGAAGMLGTTGNYAGYIVCKCICGLGIGHLSTVAPVYGAECTPAKWRGLLVAIYSIGLAFGSVCVALVCLGTSHITTSDWAWKTPIICQIPVALIYSLGLEWFPESPRWLLVQGKEEEARESFARFYKQEPHSREVDAQIYDVQVTINSEETNGKSAHWLEIFNKYYRRRTFTSTFLIISSALSGVNFIVPYSTIFLADVGIKNPFDVTVYLNLCILAGCAFGPIPVQYWGRRRSLLFGYVSMAVCMLIFSAVNSGLGNASESAKKVLIAFLCIWDFLFGAFNASVVWIASVEQHSVRHRTYGQAFTSLSSYIFNFAANFWTPYMINAKYGNMGTNVGYFYFGILIIMCFIAFFIVPETGNLTLEEIDSYYNSGRKPWKTSLKKNKLV